jgi:protein gp37
MGEVTGISWTDHTWNPWWGCSKVSAGCANCYAERDSLRFGLQLWGPGASRKRQSANYWREPLTWNARAVATGVRKRVFCASMADVFDADGLADERERLWSLIRQTPGLDWLLLTKRPENIRAMLPPDWSAVGDGYANVWLGVSVEHQEAADARIPLLLSIPARIRFLSCEPLLGPLTLTPYLISTRPVTDDHLDAPDGALVDGMEHVGAQWERRHHLHWIIAGGESGPKARPLHPQWVQNLQMECAAHHVGFFFKQWGEYAPGYHCQISSSGRDEVWVHRDGRTCRPHADARFEDPMNWHCMIRVGKKVAGDLLDGRRWHGLPITVKC